MSSVGIYDLSLSVMFCINVCVLSIVEWKYLMLKEPFNQHSKRLTSLRGSGRCLGNSPTALLHHSVREADCLKAVDLSTPALELAK